MSGKAYLPPDCYPDGSEQQKRAVEWHRDRQHGLVPPPDFSERPAPVSLPRPKLRRKQKPAVEFAECASCAAKPGTPTLCGPCLARRAATYAAYEQPKRPVRHKYGAVRTEHNGRTYASRAEANYAKGLTARKAAGVVLFWLEQVPIHLPGNTKYVVDFLEFHADGTVHFVDVKGMKTPMFTLKRKQVEALYPIEIEVVS